VVGFLVIISGGVVKNRGCFVINALNFRLKLFQNTKIRLQPPENLIFIRVLAPKTDPIITKIEAIGL
jgi:hypothetical protein